MKSRRFLLLPALIALTVAMTSRPAPVPDEGMWPFHDLPLKLLKEKYGFEPTADWLNHLRLASVKISSGGSGSFISPKGLVATNHHVALEFINQMSTASADLVENGFLARQLEDEIKVPGAELYQLLKMEDISGRVTATGVARQNQIARIEKDSSAATGHKCQVVPMHGGAQHFLYTYKVYNDVRLVWAPEKQLGYFGGDRDNFCYPRFCLDAAFLRAWEDGKPAETPNYLTWAEQGVSENDLIFISGNPARTGRYETMGQLRFKRDVRVPAIIKLIKDREAALNDYAALGDAQRIEVLDTIFGLRNSLKFYNGNYRSFVDPGIWGAMEAREAAFKAKLKGNEAVLADLEAIEKGRATWGLLYKETAFLRMDGPLAQRAQTIERMVSQLMRPEAERAPGFKGDALTKMGDRLGAQTINMELGRRYLAASFETSRAVLGDLHPFVKTALGNHSPAAAADLMAEQTRLDDAGFIRELVSGKIPDDLHAREPLLALAKLKREANERHGREINRLEEEEEKALKRIAQARFGIYGQTIYPDATFTLRLSFGVVKGYELGTTDVPWATNLWGLFGRNSSFGNKAPYDLPASWLNARDSLNLDTPMDFVCTGDTTGGNSGSPVVDRNGHIVGLLFDGNIQSLLTDNLYEEVTCRSVCVDTRLIAEALKVVYRADRLLKEIGLK